MIAITPTTVTSAITWTVSMIGKAHSDEAIPAPSEEFWMSSQTVGLVISIFPLKPVRRR